MKLFKSETQKTVTFIIISSICLFMSLIQSVDELLHFNLSWVAIILCGLPIIKEAATCLYEEFDIKADVLVSLALIASVIIGEIFAAGEISVIMTIGALLEDLTVQKAQSGIENLVKLTPKQARIIRDNKEIMINADDIEIGDIVRVIAGETIPVDGVIIKGQSSIDESIMNGESLPVDKYVGDDVLSGTINQYSTFDIKATKTSQDSSLKRMIKLVKEADSKKAPIVSLTDRWATWIVVIALVSSIGTYLVTHQILRSVTILVVFCPCALVLATPTAIMAGIGNASKYGMLIKGGDVVERLSKIKNIAFDKTGTLTYGKLSVVEYKSFCPKYDDEAFLKILASVEAYSEHPLGKAITSYYKENNEELLDIQNFTVNPGKGITANLGEKSILVGNLKLIKDVDINLNKDIINISEEFTKKGCTVIYLSIDNKLIGYVALSDILREEAKEVISYIKSQKINPVMLTGDNKNSAQNIANIVGIDDIHPSLLPEDKMNIIKNLEDSKSPTCMIGDGVNDALALKYSSVGISMGSIGSDIAIEASDIALASDDIKNIPYLLYLSKKTMKTIKLNITFSLALNFLAIILAITGILNPVVGALVHNLGSVFVILNSAKLLKTRNNLDLHIKIEYEVTNESKVALIV
ncbi:copper-(or silver)-translocating P-type ATPase [Intestinibacter bartlettii DSM 16795]|uniref:heavy metal translocating P-type ATPase n=3 Tax=Intestinibacter bartlettii TaxID=261299 RepID=UPI00016316DF|nr:cation-translocating P-type ATPase [Intestinibacter bartlettii]EDQ96146.1 cadmium-exporting ATPase [Intestinibacter bartlettii DSM 16795]MDU6198222.1 cation-translocating P-type ATPase [Intestinibacter bartlettii]UWO79848.1 cation-translocating P-type ATPase [Intestinibacter bartlettii]SKA51798.1 copper-(or silver)-translocating P-type ATPase [Intestinibacter bartlettii DSM 16795]